VKSCSLEKNNFKFLVRGFWSMTLWLGCAYDYFYNINLYNEPILWLKVFWILDQNTSL